MTVNISVTRRLQPIPIARRHDWRDASHRLEADERAAPYTQGALALTYDLPSGLDVVPRSQAVILLPPDERPGDPPEAEAWAARFLQAVVEVVSSDRPLTQLLRWTDERVYADIARRRQRATAHRPAAPARAGRQHVATVHVCRPTVDSAEVAARVTGSGRSRAIAARLDFHRGRWLCTAIRFG